MVGGQLMARWPRPRGSPPAPWRPRRLRRLWACRARAGAYPSRCRRKLGARGDLQDVVGLARLAVGEGDADPRRSGVVPGRLDQEAAGDPRTGLGDRPLGGRLPGLPPARGSAPASWRAFAARESAASPRPARGGASARSGCRCRGRPEAGPPSARDARLGPAARAAHRAPRGGRRARRRRRVSR